MLKNFLMWGERGLVATLLLDLVELCDEESLKDFINQIELANQRPIDFFPKSIECIVEPDFGNKAFGHPDGIIILKDEQKCKLVFLLEAKRTSYEKASKDSVSREKKGYNSSINGQLELNYRLTTALATFNKQSICLEEPDWILNTPYEQGKSETKRKKRRLQNENVLNNVVLKIGGLDIKSYYHLVITNEKDNPFMRNVNLPEIYSSTNHSRNIWEEHKSNFGWINYDKINAFMENFKQSRYLESFNFNKDNLQNSDNLSKDVSYGKNACKLPIIRKQLDQLPIDIYELFHNVAKCFKNSSGSTVEYLPGSVSIKQRDRTKRDRTIGKITPMPNGIFVGFRDYSPEETFSMLEQTLNSISVQGQTFIGVKIPIGPFDVPPSADDTFIKIMNYFIKHYAGEV